MEIAMWVSPSVVLLAALDVGSLRPAWFENELLASAARRALAAEAHGDLLDLVSRLEKDVYVCCELLPGAGDGRVGTWFVCHWFLPAARYFSARGRKLEY